MSVASTIEGAIGSDLPVAIVSYDGGRAGPADGRTTIVVKSPNAIARFLSAPGELGLARAYVAGDLDLDGDIFDFFALRSRKVRPSAAALRELAAEARRTGAWKPLPPPPEEVRGLRGKRHSKDRDAVAVSHHYNVGNDFYRLLLGPTYTYSCAVWETPDVGLDAAQEAKYELICRKLALRPGLRLLDVGCGWGGMVMHAAKHHGVQAVGITIAKEQATLAAKRVAEAGLADRVEIRLQDYRDVADGPYDAISSIGMFEHVGADRLLEYFQRLHALLRPQGRLLNHGINRSSPDMPHHMGRRGFIHRYVFPDGELMEVGQVISALHRAGFEERHVENLREHYDLTLRQWLHNLESSWDEAVRLTSEGRARVWRLYLAGSAVSFGDGRLQLNQVLASKTVNGTSGMPLRPDWGA